MDAALDHTITQTWHSPNTQHMEAAMDHTSYQDNIMSWLVAHGWQGAAPSSACTVPTL